MGIAIAFSSAVVVGFLGGLLTFKLKQGWCAECGTSLACPADATHEATRWFEGRSVHAGSCSEQASETHPR